MYNILLIFDKKSRKIKICFYILVFVFVWIWHKSGTNFISQNQE